MEPEATHEVYAFTGEAFQRIIRRCKITSDKEMAEYLGVTLEELERLRYGAPVPASVRLLVMETLDNVPPAVLFEKFYVTEGELA